MSIKSKNGEDLMNTFGLNHQPRPSYTDSSVLDAYDQDNLAILWHGAQVRCMDPETKLKLSRVERTVRGITNYQSRADGTSHSLVAPCYLFIYSFIHSFSEQLQWFVLRTYQDLTSSFSRWTVLIQILFSETTSIFANWASLTTFVFGRFLFVSRDLFNE